MTSPAPWSMEWLLTHPLAFGLTTATNLQRAICRIIDGLPLDELESDPDVIEAIGFVPPGMGMPKEIDLVAAVRSAKSMISAAAAVRCTQRAQIGHLTLGEVARVSIISLDKDKAHVVFQDHLASSIQRSPILSKLLVGEPKAGTLQMLHPSGRPIEIAVRAGKRAGGDLVSRWCAGAIFDEAPRMQGSDADGVINLKDALRALRSRMCVGAIVLKAGSPWAPFGPIYEDVTHHHGKPTAALVVVRGKGPQMNPSWFTPEFCADLQTLDPDAYATDVLGEFLSGEESLFSDALLTLCTRAKPEAPDVNGLSLGPAPTGDLPRNPHAAYWAAMDPATRGNAWTLVIGTREGNRRVIACARQWIGSAAKPLVPSEVLKEIRDVLLGYGLSAVESDQYYIDANIDTARKLTPPLNVYQSDLSPSQVVEVYMGMRTKLAEGELELHPDPVLLEDLRRVKRRVTQRGVAIELPVTADGRHCDYAPALMLVCARNLADVKDPPARVDDPETAEQRKQHFARLRGERNWRAA